MTAFTSQGCVIKRGDGAGSEVFTTIGEVKGFDGPSGSLTIIDVTALGDSHKRKLPGTIDEGQITMTVNLDTQNAMQAALITDRQAGTLRNFKIEFDDAGSLTAAFAAYVVSITPSASVDNAVEASITLEISGAVTWTP
ncbi:MAG: hypothetical protein INF91_05640 [Alphaproteobacteria bacterium]|nr:hypothetical protein [Alphaproteobacteria bacterium]